ncbi:NAD-dependent epimerase, partial [bacterium]|nr:NAD-dependent epimerase [bacterium]
GSEVCTYFHNKGFAIHGIDNNLRKFFFGEKGDTSWNTQRMSIDLDNYAHHDVDIRDREKIKDLVKFIRPDYIVHTAAQPSHDKAADIPYIDFEVNAVGTLNLIESCRQYCRHSPFVHMSTNKVYGDRPNYLPLVEKETRYDFDDEEFEHGIGENLSIDQTKHSLFGASKAASDLLVQEYGRYFDMPTCCLRGGCLTGPNHSGVELHGFLNYLVKCNISEKKYNIFGYKGKQVRDNIHSYDVVRFIECFLEKPGRAQVYNLGGGKNNSCSILEVFKMVEEVTGKAQVSEYIDENRIGDHIVYYSDLRKCKEHYPEWDITKSLYNIIEDIVRKGG